jgi:alpha-aminoadipic semialdehyde synthase
LQKKKTTQQAGAIVQEELSEADVIIAVKEVPTDLLIPGKTYMFFSHTIKAQENNMSMLDDILRKVSFVLFVFFSFVCFLAFFFFFPLSSSFSPFFFSQKIRLIDYELITDQNNRRLVRFGKFAGYAGMIDTMHGLGDRLLALGHSTPFLVGFSDSPLSFSFSSFVG